MEEEEQKICSKECHWTGPADDITQIPEELQEIQELFQQREKASIYVGVELFWFPIRKNRWKSTPVMHSTFSSPVTSNISGTSDESAHRLTSNQERE